MKIVIAIPTRRRPEMLASCLKSVAALEVPSGCSLKVVVVENDSTTMCKPLLSEIELQYPNLKEIVYRLEPRPGISIARNACAQVAVEEGADVLAFIDDDETVAPDWLAAHIRVMQKVNADLLGGPVRLAVPIYDMGWVDRLMFKSLQNRYQEIERKAATKSTEDNSIRTTIVTNNWMCKVAIFAEHRIFFNEELGKMGGEDTEFYKDCIAKGLKTGWVSDAIVWDHVPKTRLSVRYQFERSRDQSNAHLHYKFRSKTTSAAQTVGAIFAILLSLPFISVLTLVSPHKYFLKLVRTAGWIKGRTDALRGKKHAHYTVVTGM